ncbi:MAG: hypothetical protein JOZ55_11675 [Alphaproteobacteria bacterium]|nr:hypothetical protein [Alphaproteobacteria bacterium]
MPNITGKLAGLLVLAWTGVGLAACSTDSKPQSCPSAAILAPAATLTAFRPDKPNDPLGELYTAGLTNVRTSCVLDVDNGTTDSSLSLTFRAKRAAGGDALSYRIPYFVAVSLDGKVLTKRTFWINFAFDKDSKQTEFTDTVASTVVNLENGKKPYEYELVVGLQLTHDQLEYNKRMSRYTL